MPKIAQELNALQVARLKDQGDHHVGGVPGLLLRIAGNSRVWVLRIYVEGSRRNIGLGAFPAVTLSVARDKAREKRNQVERGEVVLLTKAEARKVLATKAAKAVTFRQAAVAMIKAKRVQWSNPKHAAQWASTLETYAYPKLGDVAITDIDVALVLSVLEGIWYAKPETASRVRGRMEAVIDYAVVKHELKMDNPARWRGHLDVLLPAKGKVRAVEHHEAVPWRDAPACARKIAQAPGTAAKALLVLLLTASRTGELLGMKHGEIDRARKLWMIPGERMKARKPHAVPLVDLVLELVGEGDPDDLVFVSPLSKKTIARAEQAGLKAVRKPLSNAAMGKVMERLEIDATPHGWRSTFRDWAAESTSYPNELLEMALAHTIENKAEAAYRRGDMIDRRRPLMADWVKYLLSAT